MLVGSGGRPMGDAHEERALLKIFAMQSGSDYLPWIARAARRVQGPCSGTFRKLGTARSSSSSISNSISSSSSRRRRRYG
jgi:hypothetical protein